MSFGPNKSPLGSGPLVLNADFKYALEQMENTRKHYFITGKAGTGKSTLLKLFRDTTKKKAVVLAPTGIAAVNVKGQTIHSFFGFPAHLQLHKHIKKRHNRKLYRSIDTIIVDEISMVRADLLDAMDRFLRINRSNATPFGGVQMIFFGDLFQLPPVISSPEERQFLSMHYNSPWFFSAHAFDALGASFEMIELQTVFRQRNRSFVRLLDAVRTGEIDWDVLEALNERVAAAPPSGQPYIYLCTTNRIADSINQKKLDAIEGPLRQYDAKISGNFPERRAPADAFLRLKIDAQVIFVKNDAEGQYVNGTIGTVVKLSDDSVSVRVRSSSGEEKIIKVVREEWEIIKYELSEDGNKIDTKTVGTFSQLPLKLAWALTIHKSQGKTFESVYIDLGRGAFESGQTYVALSRCTSLDGVYLRKPITGRDIITDPDIIDFYYSAR